MTANSKSILNVSMCKYIIYTPNSSFFVQFYYHLVLRRGGELFVFIAGWINDWSPSKTTFIYISWLWV